MWMSRSMLGRPLRRRPRPVLRSAPCGLCPCFPFTLHRPPPSVGHALKAVGKPPYIFCALYQVGHRGKGAAAKRGNHGPVLWRCCGNEGGGTMEDLLDVAREPRL